MVAYTYFFCAENSLWSRDIEHNRKLWPNTTTDCSLENSGGRDGHNHFSKWWKCFLKHYLINGRVYCLTSPQTVTGFEVITSGIVTWRWCRSIRCGTRPTDIRLFQGCLPCIDRTLFFALHLAGLAWKRWNFATSDRSVRWISCC